ncbi:hypothetical protein RN001_006689 [Aquatica leii]|uniref:Uncharacterized protein n=1 Tax=Aquatica leii TaxID=1421715 RepID=A0AAN7Q911_9COLE|nr:hypothetical protein RN001_006689 [Aquatica leii]
MTTQTILNLFSCGVLHDSELEQAYEDICERLVIHGKVIQEEDEIIFNRLIEKVCEIKYSKKEIPTPSTSKDLVSVHVGRETRANVFRNFTLITEGEKEFKRFRIMGKTVVFKFKDVTEACNPLLWLEVSILFWLYSEKNYGVEKLDDCYAALENRFQSQSEIMPESTYRKINQDHYSMIAKVKELYNAESDKSIKKKLLSILPDSSEVSHIAREFNCFRKLVLNLQNDISESENVDSDSSETSINTSNSTKAPGNQPLNLEVKKLVIDFYKNEENSIQLAVIKDFKSVKDCDGNRSKKVNSM